MVGGTKLPPQDSESGPWSHEQRAKATPRATPKPKPSTKGKRKNLRSVEVSLDNADTVIDGAPGLVLFETWDSTVASILGFWLTADRPTDFSSQTSRTESPRLRAKTSAKIEIRLGQFRGTSVHQDGSRNCPKAVFGAIWRVKSLFRNTLPISHLDRILCGDDFAKPFGLNTLRKSGVGGRE